MTDQNIAIPVDTSKGLQSERSEHFGHCPLFIVVKMRNGDVIETQELSNISHNAGGCQSVVTHLKESNIQTVVSAGMGGGPYKKLQQSGIGVLFADKTTYPDIQSTIDAMLQDKLIPMQLKQLCKGSGNCHQKGQPAKPMTR